MSKKSVTKLDIERKISEILNRLLYAQIADNDAEVKGVEVTYDPVFQYYANVCKPTKDRETGLIVRYKMSDNVKQYIAFMFQEMLKELNDDSLELGSNDDITTIGEKTSRSSVDNYTQFIFQLGQTKKTFFAKTLLLAVDPVEWLTAHIKTSLPQHQNKLTLIARITEGFDEFLKAIAFLLGISLVYKPAPITGEAFLICMRQHGMTKDIADSLVSCIRPKIPKKKSAKKTETTEKEATGDTAEEGTHEEIVEEKEEETAEEHEKDGAFDF